MAKTTIKKKKCHECGMFNSHLAKACSSCKSTNIDKAPKEYDRSEVEGNAATVASKPTAAPSPVPASLAGKNFQFPPGTRSCNDIEAELIARYVSSGDYEKAKRVIDACAANAKSSKAG